MGSARHGYLYSAGKDTSCRTEHCSVPYTVGGLRRAQAGCAGTSPCARRRCGTAARRLRQPPVAGRPAGAQGIEVGRAQDVATRLRRDARAYRDARALLTPPSTRRTQRCRRLAWDARGSRLLVTLKRPRGEAGHGRHRPVRAVRRLATLFHLARSWALASRRSPRRCARATHGVWPLPCCNRRGSRWSGAT